MSLFDHIDLQARINPDNLALAFDAVGETLSYRELRRLVRGAAGLMDRQGVGAKGRIAIHCEHPFLQIACALAASHLGAQAILTSARGEFAAGSADFVASDRSVSVSGAQFLLVEGPALLNMEGPRARVEPQRNPFWIFQTVADQPPLAILERALQGRAAMRATTRAGTNAARRLCGGSIHRERGFSAVLESLWFGHTAVISRGNAEQDSRLIALYDVTSVFLVAEVLGEYFRGFETKRAHGFHPKSVIIAGTDWDEAQLAGIKQHLCSHVEVCLDAPEVGAFAVSEPWQIGTPRVYWPLPAAGVAVVGNDGRQVAADTRGVVVVRSEAAMTVPAGHPAANRFRDGWFISDLMGSQQPRGGLVLS